MFNLISVPSERSRRFGSVLVLARLLEQKVAQCNIQYGTRAGCGGSPVFTGVIPYVVKKGL